MLTFATLCFILCCRLRHGVCDAFWAFLTSFHANLILVFILTWCTWCLCAGRTGCSIVTNITHWNIQSVHVCIMCMMNTQKLQLYFHDFTPRHIWQGKSTKKKKKKKKTGKREHFLRKTWKEKCARNRKMTYLSHRNRKNLKSLRKMENWKLWKPESCLKKLWKTGKHPKGIERWRKPRRQGKKLRKVGKTLKFPLKTGNGLPITPPHNYKMPGINPIHPTSFFDGRWSSAICHLGPERLYRGCSGRQNRPIGRAMSACMGLWAIFCCCHGNSSAYRHPSAVIENRGSMA